jgi:hypothetical protein
LRDWRDSWSGLVLVRGSRGLGGELPKSVSESFQLMVRPTLGISALDDPIVSGGKLSIVREGAS